MRTLRRRLFPLVVVLVAAFSISFAVARAGDDGASQRRVHVPGVSPEAVNAGSPPRVGTLGRAAPLPGLRARHKAAPAPASAAPAAPRPAAPRNTPATPTPVTPAPQRFVPSPTPAPEPKPKSQPKGKNFKSIG